MSGSFVIPPEHLILGRGGPEVRVSARVCALLERYAQLDSFRREVKGRNAELDATLTAMAHAANEWRRSATGTTRAPAPEPEPSSPWVATTTAAAQLNITDRGVRKAISEGRLPAEMHEGRWQIHREDLAHYRENNR